MSSRAIRRLRQEQLDSQLENVDESEEEEEVVVQKTGFLDLDDSDDSSDEESTSSDDTDEDGNKEKAEHDVTRPTVKAPKSKPKAAAEEDIDDILSSFQTNTQVKHHDDANNPTNVSNTDTTLRQILLSQKHGYDISALDLDNAVKSLLGGGIIGGVVEDEPRVQRGGRGGRHHNQGNLRRRQTVKKYLFGRPRE